MCDATNCSSIRLSETSPSDWKYVSEGGATIVFSYRGPTHPGFGFDNTVLRLRKQRLHKLAAKRGKSSDDTDDADLDDPMIEFQQKIIGRLILSEFLVRLRVVHLEGPWLEQFASHHEPSRPAERRQVDAIDLSKRRAVLATDLVGGEACVVEIKPKWGFLPFPAHLSPQSALIKTRTCRTCMHNHLRLIKGEPAAVSYCPLDLFSGTETRTARAIHGLWDAWKSSGGSVNNLRIFSQGQLLKPDDKAGVAEWARTVFGSSDLADEDLRAKFTAALLPIVLETPLLRHLSKIQRTLDALDSEGLSKLRAQAATSSFSSNHDVGSPISGRGTDLSEPSIGDWTAFVDAYLASHDAHDHSKPLPSELRYYTLAYLLSATFKDCSVLVKLPPTRDAHPAAQGLVKVIDLDPKSVKKMPGWEELDQEIVGSYAAVSEDLRRTCQDG